MEKKLFRNEHDKVLAGVSSGLADYMQIDVTIVRILFVLTSLFMMGAGLIAYLVMWIILPVKNDPIAKYSQFNEYFKNNPGGFGTFNQPQSFSDSANTAGQTKWNTENVSASQTPPDFSKHIQSNDTSKTIIGLILLILGIYFFMQEMDWLPSVFNIFWLYQFWPIALIVIGISLIFKKRQKEDWTSFYKTNPGQAPKETPVQEQKEPEEPKNPENTAG